MQAFEYASPATLKEALGLLGSSWEEAAVLAGGTDLISLMKDYVVTPRRLVSLRSIKELSGIRSSGSGLRIGAMATMQDLVDSAVVRTQYPALHEAARGIASPQIRNMGTAGGDLCQRPRCWYFRQGFGLLATAPDGSALVPNGENRYHAIFSKGPAYFVSASSLGPALIALGGTVKVASAGGSRDIAAEKFFAVPAAAGDREIVLAPGEILTEIVVPAGRGVRNATYEIRQREILDWPLATASVALRMRGNTVSSARIVLGHVAPTPWRSAEAEKSIEGKSVSSSTAEAAGEAAVAAASPLSGNAYKVQLAKVAVKRALLAAAGVRS